MTEENLSLKDFSEFETNEDIMSGLSKLLPKWVDAIAPNYADEYGELTKTWDDVCKKVGDGCERRSILVVQYLPLKNESENDKYINMIADILVSKGYLLRRLSEITICKKTGQALLSKKMFDHFKKYNNIFPNEWSDEAQNQVVIQNVH